MPSANRLRERVRSLATRQLQPRSRSDAQAAALVAAPDSGVLVSRTDAEIAKCAVTGLTIFLLDRGNRDELDPLRWLGRVIIGIFIMASAKTVLVLGGKGGLSQHYRDAVEDEGYEFRHFEKKVPPKGRHGFGRTALVVVMVSMISHALTQQVRGLIPHGVSVVYLKSPSVSALRAAVSGHVET